MQDFRRLKVWKKGHNLVLRVYKVTAGFPPAELYGLTSQMRRSAASIPTNIAEGCGRRTDQDFARFLQIAMGSASELEYQLLLSRDLGYLSAQNYEPLFAQVTEVEKMLTAFIRRLRVANRQ